MLSNERRTRFDFTLYFLHEREVYLIDIEEEQSFSCLWMERKDQEISHPLVKSRWLLLLCSTRNKRKRIYIYRSLKTLRAVGETQFDNQFISGELIVQRVAFNVSLVTLSRCANAGTAFPVMNDGNEGWGRGY